MPSRGHAPLRQRQHLIASNRLRVVQGHARTAQRSEPPGTRPGSCEASAKLIVAASERTWTSSDQTDREPRKLTRSEVSPNRSANHALARRAQRLRRGEVHREGIRRSHDGGVNTWAFGARATERRAFSGKGTGAASSQKHRPRDKPRGRREEEHAGVSEVSTHGTRHRDA